MLNRRQIRVKVMQALYAQQASDQSPETIFKMLLEEAKSELEQTEKRRKQSGDIRLLTELFHNCIQQAARYNEMVQSKAENWELERIAKIDLILMHMGISEMLNFEEIPVKVTINEYLELAKQYSTPKSSKFINGILDSLYNDFQQEGIIQKSGRGLINHSRGNGKAEKAEKAAKSPSETPEPED